MTYRILVNPGTPQAWAITLRPGTNRIGRAPENDFTVDHPSLAPRHCELLVGDAGVQLRDLGGNSGTFVQGVAVTEVWLQPGQHLQLGAVDTLFEAGPTEAPAPPVNQPAPGATIVVATFGVPSRTDSVSPLETPSNPAGASEPATAPQPPASPAQHKKSPVHFAAEREALRRQRFMLGLTGAVAGSLAGVLIWFALIKASGAPLFVMAWGVGALTGWSATRLAKQGGLPLGIAAMLCALAGIVAGESLAANAIRTRETSRQALADYRTQLEFAKAALRADSPEELRNLLAESNRPRAEEVTEEEVRSFQEQQLPHWRDFALGKPSKAEFVSGRASELDAEFNYRAYLFTQDVKSGIFLILFAALGVGTAFKLARANGRGATEDAAHTTAPLG